MTSTVPHLVHAAARGDEQAWDALIDRYGPTFSSLKIASASLGVIVFVNTLPGHW